MYYEDDIVESNICCGMYLYCFLLHRDTELVIVDHIQGTVVNLEIK